MACVRRRKWPCARAVTIGHQSEFEEQILDGLRAGELVVMGVRRVGGLITPCRPVTLQAAAGKNVVSHVGKSYSTVAHRIANELVAATPDIAAATCMLVSRIGQPVDVPHAVELQIETRNGAALDVVREPAQTIARTCLREIADLSTLLLQHASIESLAVWPGVRLF